MGARFERLDDFRYGVLVISDVRVVFGQRFVGKSDYAKESSDCLNCWNTNNLGLGAGFFLTMDCDRYRDCVASGTDALWEPTRGMPIVNLRQTAEVAALVATSATHIVESQRPIPTAALHGYWKQSRTRLKCWFAALQTLRAPDDGSVAPAGLLRQPQLVALCRDILVTEMLTRVWSTILLAADARQGTEDSRAAVDSVFRGHLEARQEVLKVLAADDALPFNEQIALDRFRRRIERWTDALIGPLLGTYGVGTFAFDEERAKEFAEDAAQNSLRGASYALTPLLLAGVKAGFAAGSDADRERSMLNLAIVRSILAAYPPDAFGSDGRLRPRRQAQMERSSRLPESAVATDGVTLPGLSFLHLRRRERSGE